LEKSEQAVIPAKAGIQRLNSLKPLDSSFRWNDEQGLVQAFLYRRQTTGHIDTNKIIFMAILISIIVLKERWSSYHAGITRSAA
jgi:hypothetical protein